MTRAGGGATEGRHGPDRGETTLIEVWAPWCSACRAQEPRVASAAATRGVAVTRVRADVERDLAEALGVRSVPTLIGVHDGTEIGRLVGGQPSASIDSLAAATVAGSGTVRARTAGSLIALRAAAGLLVTGAGIAFGSAVLITIGVGLIGWALAGVVRR